MAMKKVQSQSYCVIKIDLKWLGDRDVLALDSVCSVQGAPAPLSCRGSLRCYCDRNAFVISNVLLIYYLEIDLTTVKYCRKCKIYLYDLV